MDDDDRMIERLIQQAGGAFEPSPDLPERIGRRVRQRQVRRRLALSVSVIALVTVAVGGGFALAGRNGDTRQLETADGDRWRSTSTTTTTGTPPTTVPGGTATSTTVDSSTTIPPESTTTAPVPPPATSLYVLHGSERRLVEVALDSREVVRDVIPITGMTDVETRDGDVWWVQRNMVTPPCGNFAWEAYHPAGSGGLTFPESREAAVSPDGRFLAYLAVVPGSCEDPSVLKVRDLVTGAEATLTGLVDGRHLAWRADGSELAYSTMEDPTTADIASIRSVAVSADIVAGDALESDLLIEPDAGCSVGTPAFGPGGRLWYHQTCGATATIEADGTRSDRPFEVEVDLPFTEGESVWRLIVHPSTGQVAFSSHGAAWVLDGTTPRMVIDLAYDILWPGNGTG